MSNLYLLSCRSNQITQQILSNYRIKKAGFSLVRAAIPGTAENSMLNMAKEKAKKVTEDVQKTLNNDQVKQTAKKVGKQVIRNAIGNFYTHKVQPVLAGTVGAGIGGGLGVLLNPIEKYKWLTGIGGGVLGGYVGYQIGKPQT